MTILVLYFAVLEGNEENCLNLNTPRIRIVVHADEDGIAITWGIGFRSILSAPNPNI